MINKKQLVRYLNGNFEEIKVDGNDLTYLKCRLNYLNYKYDHLTRGEKGEYGKIRLRIRNWNNINQREVILNKQPGVKLMKIDGNDPVYLKARGDYLNDNYFLSARERSEYLKIKKLLKK